VLKNRSGERTEQTEGGCRVSKLLDYPFDQGGVEIERAGVVMICDGGEREMVGFKQRTD
jgi:phage baseplate assembly protein W